jgi:hypothetical protein
VTGTITAGGQPYKPGQGENLNISLIGTGGAVAGVVCPATFHANDSSFTVTGPKGGGVPPGTYKFNFAITVGGSDPESLAKTEGANRPFQALNAKTVEIGTGDQKLNVDLSSGNITK